MSQTVWHFFKEQDKIIFKKMPLTSQTKIIVYCGESLFHCGESLNCESLLWRIDTTRRLNFPQQLLPLISTVMRSLLAGLPLVFSGLSRSLFTRDRPINSISTCLSHFEVDILFFPKMNVDHLVRLYIN
jgi:hypothetical protein